MREIKFRAWNTQTKKMYSMDLMYINNSGDIINSNFHVIGNHYAGDVILRQYTGLKDRKGIEVFDGDIIEFDRREWGGDGNIHIVSWDQKEAAWCFGGGCAQNDMEFRTVIGNIYQNPELIPS